MIKGLFQTERFKALVKRAEKSGLIVEITDGEMITLTSKSGTVFNDTLDYDVINYSDADYYPEDRKDFYRTFAYAVDAHKFAKKNLEKS